MSNSSKGAEADERGGFYASASAVVKVRGCPPAGSRAARRGTASTPRSRYFRSAASGTLPAQEKLP